MILIYFWELKERRNNPHFTTMRRMDMNEPVKGPDVQASCLCLKFLVVSMNDLIWEW